MNNIYNIIGLILILFLQIFICNEINFLGYINPYIYVAFIFILPFTEKRFIPLSLAFLYGLTIDLFSDTGGIHAFSLVFVCYIRIFFLKIFFRKSDFDFLLFRLHQESFSRVLNYVLTLTFIHHFIMFLLANFSFANFTNLLLNTLYATIFTVTLYLLGAFLFKRKTTV